jgi:DNA-binding transcriptional regulator LsrR (DeoR family)
MDMNHWVFDANGRCLNLIEELQPFPYSLSGLEIPRIKDTIQNRNIKVILLAGGSPSYVPSIRAALKARLANILITDHITAQLLLVDD